MAREFHVRIETTAPDRWQAVWRIEDADLSASMQLHAREFTTKDRAARWLVAECRRNDCEGMIVYEDDLTHLIITGIKLHGC